MGRTKEKAHEKAHDVKEDVKLPFYLNTRTLTSHLFYGPYIWIPLLCSIVWLGGILAMLGVWVAEGKPRYRDDLPSVVFISHVGAVHHKLFMGIACTTAGLFIMSTFAERWLRGIDRLPADLRRREKVFDWLAIACAIIGSIGLILCSIFTAFEHGTFHWSMALVFIAFTALCAIFQSAEIWSLHKDHPDRRHLLRNSVVKLVVITFAVAGAISFGVTYGICGGGPQATNGHTYEQCDRISSACAALEWTIAFILFLYFLTLIADLWPAGKSSSRYMRRLARWQEQHAPQLAPTVATANGRPQFMGDDFTGRGAFAEHPERWMTAEQRAEAMEREMKARNQGMRLAHEEENVGNRYMGNGPEVPMRQQQQQPVSANAPYTTHVDPNAGYSNGQMEAPASYPNTAEATPRHSEASYAPMMRNTA